jgi:hypothetical protein
MMMLNQYVIQYGSVVKVNKILWMEKLISYCKMVLLSLI